MRAIDNTGYRVAAAALIAPGNGRAHTKDHVEARKTRACIRNNEITLTAVSPGITRMQFRRRCRRKTRHATDDRSCRPRRFIPDVSPAIYQRPLRFILPLGSVRSTPNYAENTSIHTLSASL